VTMAVEIVFETHSLTTDNEAGMAGFLDELARDWDRARVVVVGHSATRWALDYLLTGAALHDLVASPFAWPEGWSYALPSGWQRPDLVAGLGDP
jgi:hypothetical protein